MQVVADILGRRIDFMGDSGGELADRFELVGMAKLYFEQQAVADVRAGDQQAFSSVARGND